MGVELGIGGLSDGVENPSEPSGAPGHAAATHSPSENGGCVPRCQGAGGEDQSFPKFVLAHQPRKTSLMCGKIREHSFISPDEETCPR